MKKFLVVLAILCCFCAVFAADDVIEISDEELQNAFLNFSYYLGAQTYANAHGQYGIDSSYFVQGALDVANDSYQLTEEETNNAITIFLAYYQQAMAAMAASNLEYANTFLSENPKNNIGVKTTKSGLQYKIETTGKGRTATKNDTVTVKYKLYLPDDTIVDQSDSATFSLSSVIPGFAEACTLAPVGSRLTAWIHPDIGYGEAGNGNVIPPNCLLRFEIEILSIK